MPNGTVASTTDRTVLAVIREYESCSPGLESRQIFDNGASTIKYYLNFAREMLVIDQLITRKLLLNNLAFSLALSIIFVTFF